VTTTRYPPLVCPVCDYRQERAEVVRRTQEGRGFLFCSNCGNKIPLAGAAAEVAPSPEERRLLDQEQATAGLRTKFEAALVQVKTFVRDREGQASVRRCFVSYARGAADHDAWVEKRLARDLGNAGLELLLGPWEPTAPGADRSRLVSWMERCPSIVVVGTPLYRTLTEGKRPKSGSVAAAETEALRARWSAPDGVYPVLREGDAGSSLPAVLRGRVAADFRDERAYFARLFDLILRIYGIPLDSPAVASARETLRRGPQQAGAEAPFF
jgi:hypothetical protein